MSTRGKKALFLLKDAFIFTSIVLLVIFLTIQVFKVTQQKQEESDLIRKLKQVGSAYYAYYLDTSYELPLLNYGNSWEVNAVQLVSSDVEGWQGPYVSLPINQDGASLGFKGFESMTLARATSHKWNSLDDLEKYSCKNKKSQYRKCYTWIVLTGKDGNNEISEYIDMLEDYITESSNKNSGRIRASDDYKYLFVEIGLSDVSK
ncbi:MAG: hypothetical protein CFH44_00842 [Proteobacteria bacterium]|nr:MAG: hypothetical protein CFH44_00842 [Pseudomonadota bacterium]|tara:strand:+ start:157 stop:768 length:612 start_codon:yes stop_codon:yes gene_type:complete